MQNKRFRFGPVNIAGAAGNLLNPATATGGVNGGASAQYILLRKIRIVNRTGVAHNFSLYIGATGGSASGTEFMGTAKNVPANDSVDWSGELRLDAADFLSGLADTTACLTIEGEGEVGVSG
jgi:hypothetical protein